MNACDEWRDLLTETVFADADSRAQARLNEHLLTCQACQAEEQRLLELRDGFRWHGPAPGSALRSRIASALPRRSGPATVLRRPVPAYVAVAAALIGALTVAALAPRVRPPAAEAPPAAGVPIKSGGLAFVIADSYDTRVAAVHVAVSDSTLRRPVRTTDSL